MTLDPQREEALADASHAVLQHVDGTLAAVSEKIYQLLLSADIDLSEDDIRELLGEPPASSSQAKKNTSQAPTMPTLGEEDQTAADTASMVSRSTEENLASTPPPPARRQTIPETSPRRDPSPRLPD